MADELGFSRRDLRSVLSEMEDSGVVWRHVGRGTFKGREPIVTQGGLDTLKRLTSPIEVMEARLVLEPEVCRLAALRANSWDIERLLAIEQKLRACKDFESFSRWDSRFHQSIAEATRHTLFIALYGTIDALRADLAWGTLQRRARKSDWLEQAREEHHRISQAISQRDPDLAAERMHDHLQAVYSVLTQAA